MEMRIQIPSRATNLGCYVFESSLLELKGLGVFGHHLVNRFCSAVFPETTAQLEMDAEPAGPTEQVAAFQQ